MIVALHLQHGGSPEVTSEMGALLGLTAVFRAAARAAADPRSRIPRGRAAAAAQAAWDMP